MPCCSLNEKVHSSQILPLACGAAGGGADPSVWRPAAAGLRRQLRLAGDLRGDRVYLHTGELYQHRGPPLPPHLLALSLAGRPHDGHLPGHGLSTGLCDRARAQASAGNLIVPGSAAALEGGRQRWVRAGLHPFARGLRDGGPAGRGAVHDDRQPDPAPVPRGPRLAVRLGAVVRADGRGARGGAVLPARGRGEEPVMKTRSWLVAASGAGLLFLFLPIAMLIVFSFNASKLSARWQGFSLQWYATLVTDQAP